MRPRGFTLVELLVVISIISLLLGLATVAFRGAREQARAAACASNVRQLMLGMSGYEAANGTFPPGFEMPDNRSMKPEYYAGSVMRDPPGWWWFDRSQKVNYLTMDGLGVLTCPSKNQGDLRLATDILCGNYGVNLSICRVETYIPPYNKSFNGEPLSSLQIRRPSETLLLVDSGYSLISWWHVTEEPPVEIPVDALKLGSVQHAAYVPGMSINRDKALWPGQSQDAIDGRHPARTVNVGFVDGSVGVKRKADDLRVEKIDDQLWGNSPMWLPDRPVAPVILPAATP